MKILYDYGASLQSRTDDEGYTPLHLAAMWGHLDVVKWLCDHKVNLNIFDNKSSTAVNLAKQHGHSDVVSFLESI